MLKTLIRSSAAALLAASFGLIAIPASADGGTGEALATSVVQDASAGIKNAMNASQKKQPTVTTRHQAGQADQTMALPDGAIAQAPPVQQAPVGGQPAAGLPTGFTYTADLSIAYPYGNIGTFGRKWLPGGVDAVAGYGFNPTTRILASYYELQHYPVGFNSGTVPLYLQGFQNPIGCVDLGGGTANGCAPATSQSDVTTKDRFLIFNVEKLFAIKMPGGRALPIVISPTFVSRWSTIAASNAGNDVVAFEPNAPFGFPVTGVHTRTAQVFSLAVTVPFLKTSKMFGTFTVAPGWLTRTAGINGVNTAQLYQIAYLEYTPNDRTKFFFEPQSSRDYLPADPYAQHLMAYFLGVSERVGKAGFVQLVLNSGGPTNEGSYGIQKLTCQALPCGSNPIVPTIGGLKATQIQLQFGIGSPSVIPI
ncbi:MAG: hypothetical protein ACYDGM_05125 [Vulcanimicrobiaceae bacterium]